jgi:hypothetical protein
MHLLEAEPGNVCSLLFGLLTKALVGIAFNLFDARE